MLTAVSRRSIHDFAQRGAIAVVLAGVCIAGTHATAAAQTADKPKAPAPGRSAYSLADHWIAGHADTLRAVNQRIWRHPELGLAERRAADELTALLERGGFQVQRGVAGMPTAFVASAGSGRPVIGILAEFDALPGMSQAAVPERRKRDNDPDNDAGHACGHSVFGTASSAAAIAAWSVARSSGLPGTIRLYGTPAEETGVGKVYMANAGLFDDVDVALHWHASDKTQVSFSTCKAVISVKFRFDGLAAHASMSPQAGRSALDGVELMDVGVNFLREHLKEDVRIHYVITDGGGQPNVVPPTAEVWYYLRADSHADDERILQRVRDIAQGAALMSGTKVTEKLDSDSFEILPNKPLSALLQRHVERVGAPRFDDTDRNFARQTQVELADAPSEPLFGGIVPLPDKPTLIKASTDVGNVSWQVPTGGLNVACYTNGAPGHSWQIVACTGGPIGEKGMLVAARTLAGATLELLASPALVAEARGDFEARKAATPNPTSVMPAGQVAPASIR
jgi:aminobenzoyl-glutamate utilization protein B